MDYNAALNMLKKGQELAHAKKDKSRQTSRWSERGWTKEQICIKSSREIEGHAELDVKNGFSSVLITIVTATVAVAATVVAVVIDV